MILNETYRPDSIKDCILPTAIKDKLTAIIKDNKLQHMLFSGNTGLGKTSSAIALCNDIDSEYLKINSSLNNGIDTLRTTIMDFASTVSMNGNAKVIILDEADRLSAATQDALRGFIEEFSSNCIFILTANYPNRISTPLRESRIIEVEFKIPEEERVGIQKQIFMRMMDILDKEGITYKKEVLASVIKRYYPDMRRIINVIQYNSKDGHLELSALSASEHEDIEYIKRVITSKDFPRIREWANDNAKSDMGILFSNLYRVVSDIYRAQVLSASIVLLAEYQDKMVRAINPEITLAAMMIELGELG